MNLSSTIITFSLTAVILLNIFHVPLNYAYYFLDQSGFIELFCENKEEPELQCNGKCQLKKITNDTTENNESPSFVLFERETILFIEESSKFSTLNVASENTTFDYYKIHYHYLDVYNLFHPPRA